MAYLTLTFNDDREPEVVKFDGEARLIASLSQTFTFGGPEGLVGVAYSDTRPTFDEADTEEPEAAEKKSKSK